ncbi:unnamed protein product [Arabis nemorensis]|uniref:PDZ domain-containing protein n=1 Tax=Arabis nemorensis TaxID=586526 RepID=A0A565CFZ5_9BRAS|nr:unnamed protein product [Arabis nemorensis]
MEVLASSSLSPIFTKHNHINPNFSIQVKLWVSQAPKTLKAKNFRYARNCRDNSSSRLVFVCNRFLCLLDRNDHRKFSGKVMMKSSVNFRQNLSVASVRLVSVLVCSSCLIYFWGLSEKNLLFLEAWRTTDRAYIDKTFNGQSWFRYRESALRNESMNTREETYMAIKKMVATLDDPFTQSGTQGAVTGVGLSIGYPAASDETSGGLVAPGGPANRAGVSPGDVILGIDNTTIETLTIYDAAEMLQGPEGSVVELAIRSGPETRFLSLTRERVSVNRVKSRSCEIPGSGSNSPKIGYIKLTTFNQNASGAVKEAIETLRGNNVNAFVLDLRDNSGGSFPEGIAIAKIWFDKGVIVYICDSRGVRDIYDTDGSNAIATSEPLAVLVNKGTASASEILAGALKDNKCALVYGEPTYGKGKIQSVFQLSDRSGLTARYETLAHTDIDEVGVTPDHPLPKSFPKEDDEAFCGCLKDPAAACYLNQGLLFFQMTLVCSYSAKFIYMRKIHWLKPGFL